MDASLGVEFLEMVRSRLLDDYSRQVHACLQVLGEEDLWWRPNEQANAVGNLVLHVAGSNRYYLDHVIGGAADIRNRDAEFAARATITKPDVARAWDDARERMVHVLDTLTPERLTETTDRSGRASSFARILLHVTHHNSVHIGQIIWITKLRRPGELTELTRAPVATK